MFVGQQCERVLFAFCWEKPERLRGAFPREPLRGEGPWEAHESSCEQGGPVVYEMTVSMLGFLRERNHL